MSAIDEAAWSEAFDRLDHRVLFARNQLRAELAARDALEQRWAQITRSGVLETTTKCLQQENP